MKEAITKFDLESAFKALDEIDIPVANKGIKANKPALTEIFSRKSKFDSLFEEYYDIDNTAGLNDAKDAREAEVAKAKLARIEKIVDLDADSPEDLLTSYVGKYIMQCPQCMTLFYKNKEDVVESEEDPETVNVNEVCQHCGNESGYTLVGKVGEATQDEADEEFGISDDEELVAEEPVEEYETQENDSTNDAEADELDLDGELEALDLEIEDDDEDKQEESFTAHEGKALVEELREEADLEVSADEFEELINSPEFKKPISDSAARAMMDALSDDKDNNNKIKESFEDDDNFSDRIYDIMYHGKLLKARWTGSIPSVKRISANLYKVTHPKGDATVTVEFDPTSKGSTTIRFTVNSKAFTVDSNSEAQTIILKELDAAYRRRFDIDLDESLEEGVIDKIKDKFANTIDTIASKLKSREAKADWVLANAMEDYNIVQVDNSGRLVPDEKNQRFHTFIVLGFKDKYSNGKVITTAPSFSNKELVPGMKQAETPKKYQNAEKIAKGWSMRQGNGPAFIYLAKSPEDKNAVFLCEYFRGELEYDQLEKYFNVVKKDLAGAKLMANGKMTNQATAEDQSKDDKANYTEIAASELKPGMKFELNGDKVELVTIGDLTASDGSTARKGVMEVKEANGKHALYVAPAPTEKVQVYNENLNMIMDQIEALQESSLEKLISDSLVEAYGNVAGFRLMDCDYTDSNLNVDGTIYFTSGNKRKTTYTFSEAFTLKDGKVSMRGLNEKLGLDKQFVITGYTDNKTFITESFKPAKK